MPDTNHSPTPDILPDSKAAVRLPENQRQSAPWQRIVFTLLFVALLGGAVYLNRKGKEAMTGNAAPVMQPQEALNRYGFVLTESSKAAGINFLHTAPSLDPKLAHIRERVADMGASVAVADFDKDGWQDFYVTNSGENSKNALYRNNHDGTFTDVAEKIGVADINRDGTGVSMGAIWGDCENSGYEDLLVYKWGQMRLFHNDGGKGFTDISAKSGLPKWMNANTAIWLDFDGDGKLDLLIGGYFDEKLDLWHLKDTKIMPDSLEYATNGTRKYLFKGNGDGTFTDVTEKMGLNTKSWSLAMVAADLRGTGRPDIFIANDYGKSELWLNEGDRFRNVSEASGVGHSPKSGMNAAVADVLNTGKFAIYVSNISEEGVLIQGNNFWVPKETDAKNSDPVYENLANSMGIMLGGWSFGAQFADLNNDGFEDIYLLNGYLSGQSKDSYWYDYTRNAGGNERIVGDASTWVPLKGRSLSGFQRKRVWLNDGAGHFTDVAQAVGATNLNDGRSVAFIDVDNKGTMDVLTANQRGPVLLYRNKVKPGNHWIGFDLQATKSNRSAIGAQVRLFWNGQQQVQEIHGGSGFCAENQRPLHFGLGKNTKIEKVTVRWPSGIKQTLLPGDLKIDRYNRITEPAK